MKRFAYRILAGMMLAVVAGCLTASEPLLVEWPMEFRGARSAAAEKFGIVRLQQISVRPPYCEKGIPVLRADGSIAFDPYNEFAALPSALIKGVAFDALGASGLFTEVIGSVSSVRSDLEAEIVVTKLALDCSKGERQAVAELSLRLVAKGEIVAKASGAGQAEVENGCFGGAFSEAVSRAFAAAFDGIR